MANSKKPTFVTPAKPTLVAPSVAKPAIPTVKPAPVAPVAPSIVKPSAPAPAAVMAPKVEAPKVAAPKIAPVKVEPAKVEPAKVEPVKVVPVKVEAPKPVTPVAAKVAPKPVAPAQKPVEPVRAPVVAKAPVAPKAVEAAPKPVAKPAAHAFPIADVMKPVAAMQENVRANTEKALGEFRGRYAEVKGFAETATTRLEDSMKAAQSGSREIGFALFEIVKAQTHANLDHAKTLAGARSIPELVTAQQAFVLSQFQSAQTRTKDVATLAGKIASDVTSPLRASFELMLRR
jgi:hypothetical protein